MKPHGEQYLFSLLASSFGGVYVAQSLDSDVVSSGLLYVLAV